MSTPRPLFDVPVDAWIEALSARGPVDVARRAVRALYRGEDPTRVPGLSRALVGALEEAIAPPRPPVVREAVDAPDGTEKLLVALADGRAVETVLIPGVRGDASRTHMRARLTPDARAHPTRPPRASGCVSTQVGCGVRCTFCASGREGLVRNLSAGELVAQALLLRARARARGMHLASLVFMGMGEPLHNTDALLVALANLTSPWGGELGPSTVTVSTVGVVEGIERLRREGPAPNLALSLHAPDDETRARIVPLAPRLPPVRELVAVAGDYARATRRYVTVSYVLLQGVNDAPEQADALAALLVGSGVHHVNLIPWNDVDGLSFAASQPARAQAFFDRLRAAGLPVHLRRQRGAASDAACGQLRRRSAGADGASAPYEERPSDAVRP